MIALIATRLAARVTTLAGRIGEAVSLADLMGQDRLPQQTPFAHIIPVRIPSRPPSIIQGSYDQPIEREIAVVLTLRTNDATGRTAVQGVGGLLDQIILGLAGWQPTGMFAPLIFRRADLLRADAGTFVYQITFAISDELRITP